MSNQKCYSIDRCSIGESFDFSRAGSNDVSSNSIINSIVSCSVLSITIIISPQDQTVVAGGKIQFSAIVVNANDQKVKWSCSTGSIDDTGMFTAPYYAGAVSITAESFSYPRVTSTAAASVVIPDIEGNIGVQARGGSWSYCGYVPYDGVEDSPPLRYRTETPSGTVVRKDYDWLHTTLLATRTDTPIGPRTWAGCTEPTASLWQRVQTAGGACEAGTSGIDEPPSTAAEVEVGHLVRTMTNTCGSIGNGYGCCGSALAYCGLEYCGNATRTLSNPDTSDAAVARLMDTHPEWTTGLTAIRTIPTTSITGLYRQIGYGTYVEQIINGVTTWVYAPLTGLIYTQTYHIVVSLQRRPVDSSGAPTGDGSWSDAGTGYSESFQPDVNGTGGVEWQIVEPEEGYETRIASWTAELI